MKHYIPSTIEEWVFIHDTIVNDPRILKTKERISKALESNPKTITFEQAKAQVDSFSKASTLLNKTVNRLTPQMTTIPPIKDIIKDNTVYIERFKSGNLFYRITLSELVLEEPTKVYKQTTFEFPVPIADVGEAELKHSDRAIYFMRYIRKAIDDKTFLEV